MTGQTENRCSYKDLPTVRAEISSIRNEEEKNRLITKCGESCFQTGNKYKEKYYCYYHFPYLESKVNKPPLSDDLTKAIEEKKQSFENLITSQHNNFIGYSFPTHFDYSKLKFSEDKSIDFRSAVFSGKVNFGKIEFNNETYFSGAIFQGKASFIKSVFIKKVHFKRTQFKKPTDFTEAEFRHFTDFLKAKFNSKTEFVRTRFGLVKVNNIDNYSKNLEEKSEDITFNFNESEFSEMLDFSESEFKGIANFSNAKFNKGVTFEMSKFEDQVTFVDCIFRVEASFKKTTFGGNQKTRVSFSGSDFFGEAYFSSKDSLYSSWENAFFTFDKVSFKNTNQTRFISVPLNSSGFIRTDPREIEFTNVKWGNAKESKKAKIIQELALITQAEN